MSCASAGNAASSRAKRVNAIHDAVGELLALLNGYNYVGGNPINRIVGELDDDDDIFDDDDDKSITPTAQATAVATSTAEVTTVPTATVTPDDGDDDRDDDNDRIVINIIVFNIVFINVDVVIVDGLIWRDPGDCSGIPAWVTRDDADDYFIRCVDRPAPGGNNPGSRGDNDDDDDDDD